MHPTPAAADTLTLDPAFAARVTAHAGVNFNLCLHCNCCAAGCPFSWAMDYYPNQVLRMVQFGRKHEVLQCAAIWICVGCHTCSMQCPMGIDMAAVMDALRAEALQAGVVAAESAILSFHRLVLGSIERYGRTHKLEIMLRHKLHTRQWLRDVDVGLQLLAKRKLDLVPSRVEDIGKVRRLFADGKGGDR